MFWLFTAGSSAAASFISLGPEGTGILTFDTSNSVTGWTTAGVLPNSTEGIASGADLRAAVQTNTAANFTNVLATSSVGAQSGRATWHSSGQYIFTRPAGVSYVALMATLRNDSGSDGNAFVLQYRMTNFSAGPVAGHAPGWQVFYSLTGNANDWTWIPSLSDVVTNAFLSTEVALTSNWGAGTILYLLWADDNAEALTDSGYGIDDFSVTLLPDPHSPISITNDLQNLTVNERDRAAFSIGATGAPKSFHWFRNGLPVTGSNQPAFVIEQAAYPSDNASQYFVVVSNATGSVTSEIATLTVQPDLISPSVVRAIGGADPTTIRLTFSEVLNSGSVVAANFVLFESGTDPDASPYLIFAATLTDGTNVHLLTDAREPLRNYSVRIQDVRDVSFAGNPVDPNPTVVPIATELLLAGFDAKNEWRYDINNGDRTGTGWEERSYDDSFWYTGPAALGFDSSSNAVPIRTSLPYTGDSVPVYLRRSFHLPAATGVRLRLRDMVDDGAIFYIDGQEVFRRNVGTGAVTFATRAVMLSQEPAQIQGPIDLPITNLTAGDHVLAVMVVQSGTISGDMVAAVELTATLERFAESSLHVSRWTNNSVRLTLFGQRGTTNRIESITNLAPGLLWVPWQQVILTNEIQALPPIDAAGEMQFFRVVKD